MERICPVCGIALSEQSLHGETVDRCERCDGIFFDSGELESLLQLVKLYQEVDMSEPDLEASTEIERDRILICPADQAQLEKRDIAGLIVDVCAQCGGIWLDGGELAALKIAENHIKNHLNLYIRLAQ